MLLLLQIADFAMKEHLSERGGWAGRWWLIAQVRRHQSCERCRESGLGKGTDGGMGFFESGA